MVPISVRDSDITATGLYAAKVVLREILDLGYEIKDYWTISESRELRAEAVLSDDAPVKPKVWFLPHPIPFEQLTQEEKKRVMKRQKSKFWSRKKAPAIVYPVFCLVVDLGGGNFIKIILVKRPVDEDTNSELDDRWYPAFVKTEENAGLVERYFIFHFHPTIFMLIRFRQRSSVIPRSRRSLAMSAFIMWSLTAAKVRDTKFKRLRLKQRRRYYL